MNDLVEALRAHVRGKVAPGEPLGALTTFRVGGRADLLVEAESVDDLIAVATIVPPEIPRAVVGRGSNLLVADDGFHGVAVRLGRSFATTAVDATTFELGGAVYLPTAAKVAANAGLAGFEFAAEVPGAFGGAVRMNAGAHGRCVADVLVDAVVVDLAAGTVESRSDFGFAYRHSNVRPSEVVTSGRLALQPGVPAEIAARNAANITWRRENQPPGRSAGSVFTNPEGDSAGRLIDAAGAKGLRVGGAQISDVHANFIVADPGATAADVWAVIRQAQAIVRERFGVDLRLEVQVLGNPEPKGEVEVEI